MVAAAKKLLSAATSEESKRFHYPSDAREWRSWSNPEVIVVDSGLRLDEMSSGLRDSVRGLLKASLSEEGYDKIDAAMIMNGFLGEITRLKNVMNRDSYHFCLFGDPSETGKWVSSACCGSGCAGPLSGQYVEDRISLLRAHVAPSLSQKPFRNTD